MMSLFVELIQVALGTRKNLSMVPSEDDWQQIYDTAAKQSLVGIVLRGIEEIRAENVELSIPQILLLQWIGEVQVIEQQNKKLNETAELLTRIFMNGGLRSCVLKGQGVARLYDVRCKKSDVRSQNSEQRADDNSEQNSDGLSSLSSLNSLTGTPETFGTLGTNTDNTIGGSLSLRRQPGDIDLWVEGDREEILGFLRQKGQVGHVDIKHCDWEILQDVPVEVHFIPTWFYNPFTNKKLKLWVEEQKSSQFENKSELGFTRPTIAFNLVYVLIHIYRHLFDEGIGLRQLMDYYYVLLHSTTEERQEAMRVLCSFKMGGFVGAVMFVLQEVFKMDAEYLMCKPFRKEGQFLLEEIMLAGNFGHYDERNNHHNNRWADGIEDIKRNLRFVFRYPQEVCWMPAWKIWHWYWRKKKGYL